MSEVDWDELLGRAVELEAATWVTIRRAADVSGASRSTLRTWYRSGVIPSRLADGPHGPERHVPLEAVLERAAAARLRGRAADDDLLQRLADRVAEQAEEIAVLQRRIDALERQVGS